MKFRRKLSRNVVYRRKVWDIVSLSTRRVITIEVRWSTVKNKVKEDWRLRMEPFTKANSRITRSMAEECSTTARVSQPTMACGFRDNFMAPELSTTKLPKLFSNPSTAKISMRSRTTGSLTQVHPWQFRRFLRGQQVRKRKTRTDERWGDRRPLLERSDSRRVHFLWPGRRGERRVGAQQVGEGLPLTMISILLLSIHADGLICSSMATAIRKDLANVKARRSSFGRVFLSFLFFAISHVYFFFSLFFFCFFYEFPHPFKPLFFF